MIVPNWVQDAVFYQIFPDRFANGDPGNDPVNVQPWGTKPTIWNFQGGDLRGVIERFDYLLDLGINAIYFNPIFHATSNHRYNISNYYQIDLKLGNKNDFKALLDVAHKKNVRVVIDGVFNHCGRGFFAFNDVLENHNHSPYMDWFHLNNVPPDAYSPGDADDFEAWWKLKSLPKFNTDNPDVRNYIFDVARYWIRFGVDGWRLDVPNEIDDEEFWAEFRQVVKEENPEAYLVGEIWDGDSRWVGNKSFDGLMNYPIREAIIGLLMNTQSTTKFSEMINHQLTRYDQENVFAMYNLLGSHDTVRIKDELSGHHNKLKLAYLLQMALPGAPALYYGDEIGMEGGKDPDCRRAFPWDEDKWDKDLQNFIRKSISLRRNRTSLRRGKYEEIQIDDMIGGFCFARVMDNENTLIIINASENKQNFNLPVEKLDWKDGRIVRNLYTNQEFMVSGKGLNITIDAWSGFWIA